MYQKMNIPGVKFVYVGHCAEKTIFKDYNLRLLPQLKKNINVINIKDMT